MSPDVERAFNKIYFIVIKFPKSVLKFSTILYKFLLSTTTRYWQGGLMYYIFSKRQKMRWISQLPPWILLIYYFFLWYLISDKLSLEVWESPGTLKFFNCLDRIAEPKGIWKDGKKIITYVILCVKMYYSWWISINAFHY